MKAYVTGLGVVSPFGSGVRAFFDGICSGNTAVAPIASFDASTFPVRVAAEVPLETVQQGLTPEWGRDRKVGFALLAAKEALQQAGLLGVPALRESTLSLALGLETALLADFDLNEGFIDLQHERQKSLAAQHVRLRTPADLAVVALKNEFSISGAEYLHMSACAAGAAALACAASLIRREKADLVICGGTDSMVNPLGLGGMARLGATSPRHERDACRPFDVKRDGLAMGEGAAIFVVESERSVMARRAVPLAVVSGWGSSQDAYKATAPRPDGSGAVASMCRALQTACIAPKDIDYINAHGTGTVLNDRVEGVAIREVFGVNAPHVSSIKGAIGHAMAAAGALELAACIAAIAEVAMPGTTGLSTLDPSCTIDILMPGKHCEPIRRVLSNSFGFGGHNMSVIVEKCV